MFELGPYFFICYISVLKSDNLIRFVSSAWTISEGKRLIIWTKLFGHMGYFTQPQQKYVGTGENCNIAIAVIFYPGIKMLLKFLCI